MIRARNDYFSPSPCCAGCGRWKGFGHTVGCPVAAEEAKREEQAARERYRIALARAKLAAEAAGRG